MALSGEDGDHAHGVVGPMLGSNRRRFGVEGPFFSEVFGVDHNLSVAARRDPGQRGKVDGHGHDKTFGIVGVLADQVHAAGRNKDGGFGMEAGNVHGT